MSCYQTGDFVKYWEENMRALGLWIPSSSYDAAGGLTAMITAVATVVESNPLMTVSEAFRKVKVSAVGARLGALYATYWTGAAIGSIAVASGRSAACGATIADAMIIARNDFKIYGLWLEQEFIAHTELLRRNF